MTNKLLSRFIVVILLSAFLTCTVGRVSRVSAVGTTAVIAGTAFVLTGAVYLSYVALTQGQIVLPAAEDLHNWLGGIGRKVSQYPSGQATYQEVYQNLAREPVTGALSDFWSWTQDKIKSFVNDFSDTRIMSDILGYDEFIDVSTIPLNGFAYPYDIVSIDYNWASLIAQGYTLDFPSGFQVLVIQGSKASIQPVFETYQVRNYLSNGLYYPQHFVNGAWSTVNTGYDVTVHANYHGSESFYRPYPLEGTYRTTSNVFYSPGVALTYPPFPNALIFDDASDDYLPLVIPEDTTHHVPSWVDPDNNNRPIIPWVPIPDMPTGVPTPPGYSGPPQWGFPLQDLLDLLESLAEGLMEIGAIAELINRFAGQHGDNYYLQYNDGDTNYYTYYQPTIFDNDTEYVTYNIDVSDTAEHLPVDLNTIQLYTDNSYIDSFKRSAVAGGSIIRDLVVFWYDVDPEIIYVLFGTCIITLVAAFIGKWGHS